jgi:L-ribulose-5-phosphate 3-epimerase
MRRREFLVHSIAGATCIGSPAGVSVQTHPATATPSGARPGNPIAVSTYSFWHFEATVKKIEDCIAMAADMGFDGVEILERQMHRKDNAYLQSLKRQAHRLGLALCGLSAHQGFVSPNAEQRKANVDITIASIALEIPTLRVNTGRWGTTKNFDELTKNHGVEPPLPGHTDEDAFPWVVEPRKTACLRQRSVVWCFLYFLDRHRTAFLVHGWPSRFRKIGPVGCFLARATTTAAASVI